MRPLPVPTPNIDLDKSVVCKDGDALELQYWLVTELKFRSKFHKICPEYGVLVTALWEHLFPGQNLNMKKAVIVEFQDAAAIEFLTNCLPRRVVCFTSLPQHVLEPKIVRNNVN